MKIEEGKFYKTRDGRKVGPMVRWCDDFQARRPWSTSKGYDTSPCWGDHGDTAISDNVIVSEWTEDGPVRTRREIVPGTYGRVIIQGVGSKFVDVGFTNDIDGIGVLVADELRSAATIFSQLAEALDENADNA